MRVGANAHLTYCTNIHPGEDLPSVRRALDEHVTRVKARVCPTAPFGVGLRLSNQASEQLAQGSALRELRDWLDAHGCYVFTINGFPYGAFHGARVKERVYEPDWRSPDRLRYSNRLADQLAQLLPEGVEGSVSTVPCAFKAAIAGEHDVAAFVENLLQHAAHLHALRARTGRAVTLALEPEPSCYLETIEESVQLFEQRLFSEQAVARLSSLTGLEPRDALATLRRHLGLCVDACHAAVEFEDGAGIFDTLERAGIDVKKLQLSAGLQLPRIDAHTLAAVRAFADDVYLHQTVERSARGLSRYVDLPEALEAAAAQGSDGADAQWRVHCHVPIFVQTFGVLESTQAFLREVLEHQRTRGISDHLEVETYTWDVLPRAMREDDVDDAIARELRFVLALLNGELPA